MMPSGANLLLALRFSLKASFCINVLWSYKSCRSYKTQRLSLKMIFLRLCLSLRALRERLAFHAKNAKSPQSRKEVFRKYDTTLFVLLCGYANLALRWAKHGCRIFSCRFGDHRNRNRSVGPVIGFDRQNWFAASRSLYLYWRCARTL